MKKTELTLAERSQRVLKWVVREHVESGLPVGSKHLVDLDKFGVRSATLRNELSSLSQQGFLLQPHTSAGRIPSELGYRYFVNNLMDQVEPGLGVRQAYVQELEKFARDVELMIRTTSHFLGDVAQSLVLISMPQEPATSIHSIALHEVEQDTVLLIINLSLGQIRTLTLRFDFRIPGKMIKEAEQILNDNFAGMELAEFHGHSSQPEAAERNDLLKDVLTQMHSALSSNQSADFLYYGSHQLLHYPEFQSASQLEPLLEALENNHLSQHLPQPVPGAEPSIHVGSELGQDFIQDMSVVSICYEGETCSGTIHILGPTRMAYERIAGLAAFTSKTIGTLIRKNFNK